MKTLLLVALAVVVFAAVGARLLAPGWMLPSLGLLYLLVIVLHVAINVPMAIRAGAGQRGFLPAIAASHLSFLAGFLLQLDFGDARIHGQDAYTPVTSLLGLRPGAPAPSPWVLSFNSWLLSEGQSLAAKFEELAFGTPDPEAGVLIYEIGVFVPTVISWLIEMCLLLLARRKSYEVR